MIECMTCLDTGLYVYPDTTTGLGGAGGQMSTVGPCPGTRQHLDTDCPIVLRDRDRDEET